jgi:hypothetical protein
LAQTTPDDDSEHRWSFRDALGEMSESFHCGFYLKGEMHMSKSSKKLLAILGGLAVLGIYTTSPEADARPKYNAAFPEIYPKLKEAHSKVKCGMCHEGETKKVRNEYGKAIGKGMSKPNESDADTIKAAFKKAEAAKPEGGEKTFGEMIEAGDLPK